MIGRQRTTPSSRQSEAFCIHITDIFLYHLSFPVYQRIGYRKFNCIDGNRNFTEILTINIPQRHVGVFIDYGRTLHDERFDGSVIAKCCRFVGQFTARSTILHCHSVWVTTSNIPQVVCIC